MAHLGSFGAFTQAVEAYEQQGSEPDPDTFDFAGEVFTVPSGLSDFPLMEFCAAVEEAQEQITEAGAATRRAEAAKANAVTDDQRRRAAEEEQAALVGAEAATRRIIAASYHFIREAIGEQQWPRFRALVRQSGADREELMGLAAQIYASLTGRPTRTPTASTRGRSGTGDGSPAASGSPAATPGPSQPAAASNVIQLPAPPSPLDRQMAEFRAQMRPVSELLASGG